MKGEYLHSAYLTKCCRLSNVFEHIFSMIPANKPIKFLWTIYPFQPLQYVIIIGKVPKAKRASAESFFRRGGGGHNNVG